MGEDGQELVLVQVLLAQEGIGPRELGGAFGHPMFQLLARAEQLLLHVLSLRDVGHHPDQEPPSHRVDDQRLAGEEHVDGAGRVGERLLVLDHRPGGEDEVVLSPELVGLAPRRDVVVGPAQEFVPPPAQEATEPFVHEHPTMALVLDEHRVGKGVEEPGQERQGDAPLDLGVSRRPIVRRAVRHALSPPRDAKVLARMASFRAGWFDLSRGHPVREPGLQKGVMGGPSGPDAQGRWSVLGFSQRFTCPSWA